MDQQIKVALVGKKKSGRTFVANYFRKKHKFKAWGLDDGVKRIYRTLYEWHNGKAKVPWEKQLELYDFLYAQDNDIWVRYLEQRLQKSTSNIVIDDVRYINEVLYLKKLGFTIIRVTAPDNIRRIRIQKQLGKLASSGTVVLSEYFAKDETAAYQVDYSLHNDKREETKSTIDFIIEKLTQPQ